MRKFKYSAYSLILALVLGGIAVMLTGHSPLSIYVAVVKGAFGSLAGFMNVLAYTTPIIIAGIGATVAFTGGIFNIGGEGQLLVGGLCAVIVGLLLNFPFPFGLFVSLLAGFLGGVIWALMPTLMLGRNLNTLAVGTIMMTNIGALFTEFIVKNYFQRPAASATETEYVNDGAILPRINQNTQFNYGIILSIALVALVAWLLYRTRFGFSIRTIGANRNAARQSGINVHKTTIITMAVSGGIFGLAGAVQCLAIYKRFMMGFSPGYGWDGITVATLAGYNPFGTIISGFLFGMLRSASISMSLSDNIPVDLISLIQGLVVILVASPMIWTTFNNLFSQLRISLGSRFHTGAESKVGKQDELV